MGVSAKTLYGILIFICLTLTLEYMMFPVSTPEGLVSGSPFTTQQAIWNIQVDDDIEKKAEEIKDMNNWGRRIALITWYRKGEITGEEMDYLDDLNRSKVHNFILILENLITFDIKGLPSILRFVFVVPIWLLLSYTIISLIPGVG